MKQNRQPRKFFSIIVLSYLFHMPALASLPTRASVNKVRVITEKTLRNLPAAYQGYQATGRVAYQYATKAVAPKLFVDDASSH